MKLITGAFIVMLLVTVTLIVSFKHISAETSITTKAAHRIPVKAPAPLKISDIPLPEGYTRVDVAEGGFGAWLQNISLRQNNIVHLYNGAPLERQDMHYAVLDISTGDEDLQQCADAIMRLRAEYYFSRKEYAKINFKASQATFNFSTYAQVHNSYTHDCLLQFMQKVFINCGTYTVDDMTKPVAVTDVQAGDVFVKAGAPGHAMIVVNVAANATGDKIYMLAQSYMPAQDMHIVINPTNAGLSPWYAATAHENVVTPGWVFTGNQLKRWK